MPTQEEKLLIAVAGKGVERGLDPEQDGNILILRYPGGATDREDNLHKQSIRSLVQRMAPDWKIHIASVKEDEATVGMSVEVRPKPGNRTEGPQPEKAEYPADAGERLARMAEELEELARELRTTA
jgi:hypothetical protein